MSRWVDRIREGMADASASAPRSDPRWRAGFEAGLAVVDALLDEIEQDNKVKAAKMRVLRTDRIGKRLCKQCGAPAIQNRVLCRPHLEKQRQLLAKRYAQGGTEARSRRWAETRR